MMTGKSHFFITLAYSHEYMHIRDKERPRPPLQIGVTGSPLFSTDKNKSQRANQRNLLKSNSGLLIGPFSILVLKRVQ